MYDRILNEQLSLILTRLDILGEFLKDSDNSDLDSYSIWGRDYA